MKKCFVVFLFLLCASTSSIAQQVPKADIQSLDAKLTKLQETVTGMDKRLTNQITESDKRLSNQIAEVEKRLSNQIATSDTFVKWAVSILILVVLTVIALPQIFGYLRDKKEREGLQKRVEHLKF